jgi:hypothetical protein
MAPLSRRSLLAGAAGAVLLAACGGDDDDTSTGTTSAGTDGSSSTAAAGELVLGSAFDVNGLLVAGIPQRAAYVLFLASGGPLRIDEAPPSLTLDLATEAGEALGAVEVALHGADIERAYYPLVTTFPTAGVHRVTTEVEGQSLESLVAVNNATDVAIPQVGDALPAPPTPTVAAPLDAQTICTREPACPFHEVSLDAAVGTGPIAFMISTPAYCNTAICGPVLEQLITAAPSYPGLKVVHLEVYPFGAPPDGEPSPLVPETFGMTYEPALYVADAAGTTTARLDNVWDGTELSAALGTV